MTRARHLKVIVFSDIFDSSAQIFADELIAIQHIKQDLALIREAVQRHDGCLVKSLGDGILATFDAPTQALEFIRGVIRRLHDRGHRSLQHRFGMHTGEIYADGDDILGQGVHLASRLQTVSPPNGVAFVQSTYELVAPEFRRHAECMGATPLKGLPGPMVCYCLREQALLDSMPAREPPRDGEEDLLEQAGYQRLRLLGQSPNRKTELVRNRRRDRLAVLKTFRAAPEVIDSLRLEAARLDRLRHPRIPRFLDEIVAPDRYLFIQEYIPGASLQGSMDVLRRKQRLAHVLRQMLEVLDLVHNAGLVHGDINPGNLIPAREGDDVFLVDFALVRARTEAHGAQPGSEDAAAVAEGAPGPAAVADPPLGATPLGVDVTARPFYSPPERARFGRLWPGGDLYSLGVTALSLYCGRPPEELYDQSLSSWRFHDLDREVVAWLAPLLEESPGRRLPRAADVLQLLDRPQPAGPPAQRRVRGGAPAGDPGLPALQRETLARRLTDTYGLVVDLLLESWPSTIAPEQRRALRERLLSSGLRADDIDAAFAAAAVVPEADIVPEATGEPAPSPAAPPAAAPGRDLRELRDWFLAQIGPIAEVLWNADLEAALRGDPAAAAASLAEVGVPEGVIRELLQRVGRRPAGGPSPAPEPRPAPDAPAAIAAAGEALRQAMVSIVGPIGDHLFEQEVSPRPAAEQLAAALAVFRRLGLDPALGEELRRRWEG